MGADMGRDAADLHGPDAHSRLGDVLHATARGAVGAMTMTGMRVLTTELGLVEQTPPQAVSRQRARGARALLRLAPRKQRRGLVEAAHWTFGAGGGAVFGALPETVRRRPWAGPAYGLVVWLGFELGDRARPGPQPGQARAPGRPARTGRRPRAVRPGAIGDASPPATLARPRRDAPSSASWDTIERSSDREQSVPL